MKASDLFVRALEAEGVEYVFAIPGEENLDLLEALRGSRSIKLVVTRHEQGAGFMAATYGRLTGKAGVCLSTLGPGATNLVDMDKVEQGRVAGVADVLAYQPGVYAQSPGNEGVKISVRPDLLLHGTDRRGRPYVGALKIHISKHNQPNHTSK